MPKYELLKTEQLIEPEIAAREGMDENKLAELCESVKAIGFIHPLAVVLVQSGRDAEKGGARRGSATGKRTLPQRYEIVDGHRRYKVAIMLSLETLPCLIFEDARMAREAVKLHANLFREDLSTAEEAAFIADLIAKYDYTEEQLCRALHCKPTWINERLALLHGAECVFNALRERKINLAVAKQLNRVKDEAHTKYLLSLAVEGGATALTVTQWVTEFLRPKSAQTQTENIAAPGESPVTSEPLGVACFLCRKPDNPYNLENVWIHPWEKKMLEAQIDRAADVPPDQLREAQPQNGRSS